MANRWLGRDGARLVAAGRVALGVGMVARPDLLPKLLGVDSGTASRMSWLGRMFGAREIALGAGLLVAGRDREGEWLLGAALSDAVDAVAFAEAARRGVVRPALGGAFTVTAATAAGTEVAAWLAGRD
ncbi:MAG TPA: hypothetical protein VNA20_01095 [Frankiaceae bacterium]|nr:hypothetical protein [Frankiaceae bacterium]